MNSPDDIEREIEQTRASLSADVNRLGEKVSPSRVVNRRVGRVKQAATSVKERVMGSPADGGGLGSAGDAASSAKDAFASAASSVSDIAAHAPRTVRRQTQGNPLAAGLVAFGVGWLAASLLPAGAPEQQVAKMAEDKAGELARPLKEKAQEVAGNLRKPLQHSAEQIKSTATQAASETADQAKSAAADVQDPLQG